MGLVAFGEQTVPSGIAALLIAMMPVWVAILGRIFLGERLPRAGGRRHRRRVRRRRDPRRTVGARRRRSARSARPASRASSRRSPGRAGRCSRRIGPTLPRRPLVATGLQMVLGGLVLAAVAHGHRRGRHVRPRRRSPAIRCIALLYLTVVGSLLAFTVYGWLLRVAPLPLVDDLRLRQSGRRGHPRRDRPQRADRPADGRRRRDHRGAVALIVTARGRMPAAGRRQTSGRPGRAGPGSPRRRPRAPSPTADAQTATPSRTRADQAGALPALGRPRLAAERPVLAVAEGVVGLDERVELARALVDDGRLRVAQVALDRELVRVAVGAVDLDRVERGLDRVLGGVPLGEARLAGVAQALVLEPAGPPDEQPARSRCPRPSWRSSA